MALIVWHIERYRSAAHCSVFQLRWMKAAFPLFFIQPLLWHAVRCWLAPFMHKCLGAYSSKWQFLIKKKKNNAELAIREAAFDLFDFTTTVKLVGRVWWICWSKLSLQRAAYVGNALQRIQSAQWCGALLLHTNVFVICKGWLFCWRTAIKPESQRDWSVQKIALAKWIRPTPWAQIV